MCDSNRQLNKTHWIFNEFRSFNITLMEKIVFLLMMARSGVCRDLMAVLMGREQSLTGTWCAPLMLCLASKWAQILGECFLSASGEQGWHELQSWEMIAEWNLITCEKAATDNSWPPLALLLQNGYWLCSRSLSAKMLQGGSQGLHPCNAKLWLWIQILLIPC